MSGELLGNQGELSEIMPTAVIMGNFVTARALAEGRYAELVDEIEPGAESVDQAIDAINLGYSLQTGLRFNGARLMVESIRSVIRPGEPMIAVSSTHELFSTVAYPRDEPIIASKRTTQVFPDSIPGSHEKHTIGLHLSEHGINTKIISFGEGKRATARRKRGATAGDIIAWSRDSIGNLPNFLRAPSKELVQAINPVDVHNRLRESGSAQPEYYLLYGIENIMQHIYYSIPEGVINESKVEDDVYAIRELAKRIAAHGVDWTQHINEEKALRLIVRLAERTKQHGSRRLVSGEYRDVVEFLFPDEDDAYVELFDTKVEEFRQTDRENWRRINNNRSRSRLRY